MEWLQRLRQGSFRGVPFQTEVSDRSGGRKTVEHSYPGRDFPVVEDLGRAARRFSFEAFVIGDDYLDQRDALLDALERPGQGVLVHPYYGVRRVHFVGDLRVVEGNREAGMARFSLEFVESDQARPEDDPDTVADTDAAAAAVTDQAVADFADSIVADGQPEWVLSSAQGDLTNLSGILKRSGLQSAAQGAADFAKRADALSNDVLEKLRDPFPLGREVVQLIEDVDQSISGKLELFDVYVDTIFSSLIPRTLNGTSIFRSRSNGNSAAVARLVDTAAVANAARVGARADWDSLESATVARDRLADQIDQIQDTAPDGLYNELEGLRARVVAGFPNPSVSLPRLGTYTAGAPLPALVLSYKLYGTVDREADIVARNRIPNPAFVPAGRPLEVISVG